MFLFLFLCVFELILGEGGSFVGADEVACIESAKLFLTKIQPFCEQKTVSMLSKTPV